MQVRISRDVGESPEVDLRGGWKKTRRLLPGRPAGSNCTLASSITKRPRMMLPHPLPLAQLTRRGTYKACGKTKTTNLSLTIALTTIPRHGSKGIPSPSSDAVEYIQQRGIIRCFHTHPQNISVIHRHLPEHIHTTETTLNGCHFRIRLIPARPFACHLSQATAKPSFIPR